MAQAFWIGVFVGVLLTSSLYGLVRFVNIAGPWLRAFTSGGRVSLVYIIGMRLRGSPISLVLDAYLAMVQAGEQITIREVESRYIANKTRIASVEDLLEFVRKKREDESSDKCGDS